MDKIAEFKNQVQEQIKTLGEKKELKERSLSWMLAVDAGKYTYNFSWLGRPIIQYPQDMIAMQEIIWNVKPDLIVETGIAHGGSLIFSASMIALLESTGAIPKGKVLGVDIDIRKHNRVEIEKHPLSDKIDMIQGSSIDPKIIKQVYEVAKDYNSIMVCLDSNHTHEHVLAELEAYAPLVSIGSYCVVFDTVIEDTPDDVSKDRPWGKGNNPKTAVWEYLKRMEKEGRRSSDGGQSKFVIDKSVEDKLLITVAPDGYLKRI